MNEGRGSLASFGHEHHVFILGLSFGNSVRASTTFVAFMTLESVHALVVFYALGFGKLDVRETHSRPVVSAVLPVHVFGLSEAMFRLTVSMIYHTIFRTPQSELGLISTKRHVDRSKELCVLMILFAARLTTGSCWLLESVKVGAPCYDAAPLPF